MSDKMLMEDWRKFLTESPRRYMDDYDPKQGAGAQQAAKVKKTKEPPKENKPSVPLGVPTVREYLFYIQRASEGAAIESRWKVIGDVSMAQEAWTAGGDAISQGVDALAGDYRKANEKKMSKTEYRNNPFLIYMDIWDPYYDVVQEKIIADFFKQLGQQLKDKGTDLESDMPDIDHLLEQYIKNKYNGVILDGAPHAENEWAERARANIERLQKQLPFFGAGNEELAKGAYRELYHIGRGFLRSGENLIASADRLVRSLTLGRFDLEDFVKMMERSTGQVDVLDLLEVMEKLAETGNWPIQQREEKL